MVTGRDGHACSLGCQGSVGELDSEWRGELLVGSPELWQLGARHVRVIGRVHFDSLIVVAKLLGHLGHWLLGNRYDINTILGFTPGKSRVSTLDSA